jgi:hypothetical protein
VTDGGSLKDYPGVPFLVLSTSSIDDHLSAGCAYQYIANKGPVVLHGTRNAEGEFAPFVSYQVAVEGTTKWKTIGKSPESSNPVQIEISPANPRMLLDVDMEVFRSRIGKFRWGRIVLENGDAAPFSIDDLLPTGNNPDAKGNFKQFVNDLDPYRFGSSFKLGAVTCFSNKLVGDFYFIGGPKGSSIELQGAQTPDGDFWPSVTLEAGNSEHDWQAMGKSTNEGAQTSLKVSYRYPLEPIRVVLDAYKPAIGRFKLGKIIFSNGKFAVFEIAELKPH